LQEILKQENDLSLALQRVTGYDGPTSIAQERAELEQERIKLAAALEEKKAIEFKLSSEAANLAYLQKKIEETIKATEANKKTKEYTSILSTVYEGLHPSVFARQLIGMYAGAVQDKLNEYLCMFDFPYSVLIDEGFNLSAYNREGKLPFLSGGQQVVVGLSLRFALHDLFSQSMPLIMIDEGSMSLHESNVQAYFELLRKVKSSMKFKQIIIIDHHAGLADVVDTPIVL
jgi:DNA repair exonuclease SbcCD ATPase subunit